VGAPIAIAAGVRAGPLCDQARADVARLVKEARRIVDG
jgi:hypothetical protein